MDQSNRGTAVSASLLVILARNTLHAQQDLSTFSGKYRGNGKQPYFRLEAVHDGQAWRGVLQLPGLRYLRLQGQIYLYKDTTIASALRGENSTHFYGAELHFGKTTAQIPQWKYAHMVGLFDH